MEITAHERVEKGIELDTAGQDSIDLIAIRIDTLDDLPDDTEMTVVFRGRELLCIPIQRMTRSHLSLWSIPFNEFAKETVYIIYKCSLNHSCLQLNCIITPSDCVQIPSHHNTSYFTTIESIH
jgi:hypothetical protein